MTTKYYEIKKIFDYDSVQKEVVTQCPGCEGTDWESSRDFGYIDRYGYYARTSWCSNCAMVYLNPRMPMEQYNRFYASGAYRQIVRTFGNKARKPRTNGDFIPGRIRVAKDMLRKSALKEKRLSMLDIGGTKTVFDYLNTRLKIDRYACINPSGDEIRIRKTESHKVFEGSVEDFDSNEEGYDFICLFGTLNHLIKPLEVFRKVSTLLKDNGRFAFDHVNRISKMTLSGHPSHQIQIDHAVYPGSVTVLHMLGESGLEIDKKQQSGRDVEVYLVMKGNRQQRAGTGLVDLPELAKLSGRMTSIPLTYLFKSLSWRVRHNIRNFRFSLHKDRS
jgi:hypothetical protein